MPKPLPTYAIKLRMIGRSISFSTIQAVRRHREVAGYPMTFGLRVQGLLMTVIRLTEAAVKGMAARRWGRILTVAPPASFSPFPISLFQTPCGRQRRALASPWQVRSPRMGLSNMILPGRINTGRLTQINTQNAERQGMTLEAFEEASLATIPAVVLARQRSLPRLPFFNERPRGYVTGSMVRVDGGIIKGFRRSFGEPPHLLTGPSDAEVSAVVKIIHTEPAS